MKVIFSFEIIFLLYVSLNWQLNITVSDQFTEKVSPELTGLEELSVMSNSVEITLGKI